MTMKIIVTNGDQNRAARVCVRDIAADGTRHNGDPAHVLKPGESVDCWIHSSRDVQVDEMPEGWDAPLGDAPEETK
jgi:hypothetical protein